MATILTMTYGAPSRTRAKLRLSHAKARLSDTFDALTWTTKRSVSTAPESCTLIATYILVMATGAAKEHDADGPKGLCESGSCVGAWAWKWATGQDAMIRVNVQVKLDIEEAQRILSPEQFAALVDGLAMILAASHGRGGPPDKTP